MEHWSHPHPLTQCNENNGILCSFCQESIYYPNIYGCTSCNFYLHKSPCAELPHTIQHPFHPPHPLTLSPKPPSKRPQLILSCHACWDHLDGFHFHCPTCRFYIDVKCAFDKPAVKIDRIHNHPIAFFKTMVYYEDCDVCGKVCRDGVLRCVPCNFNVHVHCVSELPETVRIKYHRHELNFTKCLEENDLEEFYCNACEELRTPNQCAYYCAHSECYFVAHVYCGISESQILQNIQKEAKERGLSVDVVATVVDKGEVAEDPFLFDLDEEIASLRSQSQTLTNKLKEIAAKSKDLEKKRVQYLASSSSK